MRNHSHAGAERKARLLAEADALARLRHPHIVQVYEVGQHEGVPCVTLPEALTALGGQF